MLVCGAIAAFPSAVVAQQGDVTVTTVSVELGESTSITRAPTTTSTSSAIEVKGKQVVVDPGTDWWWWLLLLLLLPAAGLLFGLARQRLSADRSDR